MSLIFKKDANLQEMITSSDTTDIFESAINTYLYDMEENAGYDREYEKVFSFFDTSKQSEEFPKGPVFAITFNAVAEGEPPKFGKVSDGDTVTVRVVHYRAGLRYSKDWFRYNQIPLVEKATQEFRDESQRKLCQIYYGIIENAVSNGTTASANTPLAIGSAIDEQVVAMMTPSVDANGNPDFSNVTYPKMVMCNVADETLVSASLNNVHRLEIAKNQDGEVIPLNSQTASLEVVSTPWVTQGRILVIEPKKYFVGLRDGSLELDTDDDKLFDAENLYGSLRRGGACLSSYAIRYVDLA